jgi:thioredoxin-related protein
MDAGVLKGADFHALAARMILLRSNVDEAEGKALQKRFLAPYTPAFLLIRPDGREIGRMVGWQPSGKFLTRLYSWLNRSKEIKCPSSPSNI